MTNDENKNQEPQKEIPKEEKPKKSQPEAAKKEKPEACATCGKNIDNKRYYREGKYYCGKHCWKKSKKQAQEKSEKEPPK